VIPLVQQRMSAILHWTQVVRCSRTPAQNQNIEMRDRMCPEMDTIRYPHPSTFSVGCGRKEPYLVRDWITNGKVMTAFLQHA